jgi:Fe-S cluster assembly protein SufD
MSEQTIAPAADRWSAALKLPPGGPGWLTTVRERAAGEFRQHGLPDRKTEAWKYTPMRLLESLELDGRAPASPGSRQDFDRDLPAADTTLDIVDARAPAIADAADGLSLLALDQGLARYGERLRPLLEAQNLTGPGNAFRALNTALLADGLVVHVAEGVNAGTVRLRWAFGAADDDRLANFRLFVLLDPGAELELQEHFESPTDTRHGLNLVCQADLGRGAQLRQVRVQLETERRVLLTETSVRQAAESRYSYHGFDLGGRLVRHAIDAVLLGEDAETGINGAFALDGQRHVDNHVSVDHASGGSSSRQFFRGVLSGSSRGVFNGRALIRAGADNSSVHQSNANLLLSGTAEMDSKPELEIYADEVEASHGATVGQLDEDAIFYLRTRGLSDTQARRMLTAAFCRAVTDNMENRALADRIAALLDEAMPGHAEVHYPGDGGGET